jgi:hypothetical protein
MARGVFARRDVHIRVTQPEHVMAELHIEKKPKSQLAWLVIAAIVVAVAAWLAQRSSNDTAPQPQATTGVLPAWTEPVTVAAASTPVERVS